MRPGRLFRRFQPSKPLSRNHAELKRTPSLRRSVQLRQIATQAFAELQANAPGEIGSMQSPSGTGFVLQSLINGWNDPTIPHRNYTVLNLGQLKAVAKPFYDRLIEIGYTSAYPWPNPATPPDDYAVANLGQMKNLFSFDLTTSTANDGILDLK